MTLSWSPQAWQVFGEFIDRASRLFADALTHQLDDPSKPAPLYEGMGKVRLHASNEMDDSPGSAFPTYTGNLAYAAAGAARLSRNTT
jgi:hypothetical protein